MKVGDKVRVIQLVSIDRETTDLKVGDTGVVVAIDEIVSVKIDRDFKYNKDAYNYNESHGSYDFLISQLEVIDEKNTIPENTTDSVVTVRLRLDTNSDFFIDALIENGYWVRQETINDTYVDVKFFKEREDE